MSLQPLFDKVLIKRDDAGDQMTAGGLYLPDTAKAKPNTGTVVAVGPGKFTEQGELLPMMVKTGDKVLFAEYGGLEVDLPEGKFLLMSQGELLGVFRESA